MSWFSQGLIATWQSPFPPLFSCVNKAGRLPSAKVMLSLASIGTMHPSDFHNDLLRLRYLIRSSRRPPRHRYGSPALDNLTSDTCRPCYPDGSLVWLPLSTYQYYGLPYTDTRSATILSLRGYTRFNLQNGLYLCRLGTHDPWLLKRCKWCSKTAYTWLQNPIALSKNNSNIALQ